MRGAILFAFQWVPALGARTRDGRADRGARAEVVFGRSRGGMQLLLLAPSAHGEDCGEMPTWTIGIEITGTRIDGEGILRLDRVFKSEFPDLEVECELWSGWLAVHGIVQSATPTEALDAALAAINSAFAWADVDLGVWEITHVTMRRGARSAAPAPSEANSLPQALLRLVSPSRRE
jgi:hypothetical protein